MIIAIIEIAITSAFGIYILISHRSINKTSVFNTKYSLNELRGIGIGVMLIYTAFFGFGASATFGEGSVSPRKKIGKSMVFTVISLGLFLFSDHFTLP